MSEREKKLIALIAQMPEAAQDTFLAQAQGAVVMLDALRKEEGEDSRGGGVENA